MDYIPKDYDPILYSNAVQQNPNLKVFDGLKDSILDYLFVADDSEWESPIVTTDEVGTRKQEDIISHQYVAKLPGYPAIGYILYRNKNDKPFKFWDLLSVVKQYLNDIGYKAHYTDQEIKSYAKKLCKSNDYIKQHLFPVRIPPIMMVGYFGGVDVSAYEDWYKYLEKSGRKKDANVITLYQHAFFTRQFVTEIVSPDHHRKVPVTLQYRDMMALGPQGGLKKLGEMVKQPKVDTTVWDEEDGKPSGYYKTHMRELLQVRPDDYQRYSMNDAEITLKYLGFVLRMEQEVYEAGLLKQMYIPATLTGLSDQLTNHYLNEKYSHGQVKKITQSIFNDQMEQYLRPKYYNQMPTNSDEDWKKLIISIKNTKRKSIVKEHQLLVKN